MKDLDILILMCYFERPHMASIALTSVFESEYQNWHLAVVDDGSTKPIGPVVERLAGDFISKVTIYETGDSVDQKRSQGGSRFGAYWNRAIREIPADVGVMLCDDDALMPDYLGNLNAWFKAHPERGYCYSHIRPFDPLTVEDLLEVEPGDLYRYTEDIVPESRVDASQVAWRLSCHKEGNIWFPHPQTKCLDASLYSQLYRHYGPCPFSGYEGQFKGVGHYTLGARAEESSVRDRDGPYTKPKIRLFRVGMSERASEAAARVLDCGYVGQGPVVEEFEARFQEALHLPHRPLFLNSGTSAITLALDLAGVQPGDEVVTTPMTCLATNLPILHRFATPVWADVDPVTGLIDPESVAQRISDRTRAIIAVDWAGRPCDYQRLRALGLPVIQDAAHCLHVGRDCGDYVCWSFQAIKFLTTVDGGALLVPRHQYDRARLMRWFGLDRTTGESFRCSQNVEWAGYKFQPHDVGASIGLANLPIALENVERARSNAARLMQFLRGTPSIVLPPEDDRSSWWLFTVIAPGKRDALQRHLADLGIESSQVHSRNDRHSVFQSFGPVQLPGLDHFSSNQLALPCGWWLRESHLKRIADAVRSLFEDEVAPASARNSVVVSQMSLNSGGRSETICDSRGI